MLRYFAKIDSPKRILWCYLVWYVAIVAQYFEPHPNLWISSLGIAVLIGFALNLAASQKGQVRDKWVVFRLYIFPFCVSSYSALIKGKGFFLLFPTDRIPFTIAVGSCLLFLVFASLCKFLISRKSIQTQTCETDH
jgi:hypothetical protein